MAAPGIVTFDYAAWSGAYPEFNGIVSAPQATSFFAQACLYCDNTACSPIIDASVGGIRSTILYMLTAHIAQLRAGSTLQAQSSLVGRINQAAQGSVSVATELDVPGSASWFAQTEYGLSAWQAMAPFRTALYVAPPQIPLPQQSFPLFPFGVR